MADRVFWIEDLSNSYLGDSNFDGQFDSSDLVTVFTAGKYETGASAIWSEGDWNGDGVFDTADFVTALGGGGFEAGVRDGGIQPVPEPVASRLALLGCLAITAFFRHSRTR